MKYLRKAKNAALKALKEAGIDQAPVDVFAVATALGVQCRAAELGDDVSGLLVMKHGTPVVGYNRRHSKSRQRFTVAHELAHYRLHVTPDDLFIDKGVMMWHRDEKSSTGEDQNEKEANAFAAELLMPESFIEKEIGERGLQLSDDSDIEVLAQVFEVSVQAMTFRLLNLNIIRSTLN